MKGQGVRRKAECCGDLSCRDAVRAGLLVANTAIVVLMVGIFSLGLVGYLGVCYWVS